MTEQLYEEQKEDLIGLFSASTTSHMTLEEFVPLARTMITMVYRRHYEGPSTVSGGGCTEMVFVSVCLCVCVCVCVYPHPQSPPPPLPFMLQDEWLELSSNKFGAFWLNKNTGETLFPQEMQGLQSPVSVNV